ncbi:MAG: RES family NAD+ phosphorylase [Candidatus Korobacteraceae bacterium]
MKLPPLTQLRQDDTHRLVPSKYALDEQGALTRLAGENSELNALSELESSTDNRVLGESGLLPGIGIHELVFGVSYAHIVNAAFTYAHPGGSRFNGPERGAWYTAFRLETSQAEIAFHRGRELQEINWPHPEVFEYVEYLADFRAEFQDIRRASAFRDCLAPDGYAASQRLARVLLEQGSAGIVYPSVREKGHGDCLSCFRPALVMNVRKGIPLSITFENALAMPVFERHS